MSDHTRIEAFLEMMSAERGAAQNTLDAYARDLIDASDFLNGKLVTANAKQLSKWLQSLSERGLAASTAARRLSAIKHFFKFLFEERDRKDNPTSLLDAPKTGREIPDVLSREEMMQLIEACGTDVRLRCLVECLYGAGLRVTELVSLTVGELPRRKAGIWQTSDIIVRGKGGKERLCPLGAPALDAISDWLELREDSLPKNSLARGRADKFVFPSRGKDGHLTRRRLGQMLEALAAKAGLAAARVHPHALHHAYACLLYTSPSPRDRG